ncbi:hypothetical protein NB647_08535 [Oxalobacter aliiformigenes]|uniref:hypothetical protein n=1 Tax=Oxalobacter aliiformigenes TaxID=2946593 RepID=UPI0022AEBD6A|nr:hypothetical protein [Oxalobacter aliiformigenes]WAV88913.1 hypothetical protein NB647_08535 [Oxalobacter aliiformigenes]
MKKLTIFLAALIAGCAMEPPNDLFVPTKEMLTQRQLETRRYEGLTEEEMLIACSNVLQDLGYTLENSETKLGVLTSSKTRDATNGGEIAANILLALLGSHPTPMSKDQTIRVSLVVKPVMDNNGKALLKNHTVRITFQRIVTLTNGSTREETLRDPELYTGFHDKLSKSVFLEAHNI